MRNVLRDIAGRVARSFNLKQPGPLKQFAIDFLGVQPGTATRPYAQSIWVYRCVNMWARLGQIPLLLTDAKGKPVDSGSVAYLLENPRANMSIADLIEITAISLAIDGQYFWLREDGTNFKGVPTFLTPVWPKLMSYNAQDIDRSTGCLTHWRMSLGGGRERRIPAEGIIHGMLPNPYSTYEGLSPLEALRLTVDADYAARAHNKTMMQRHGRIGGIVSFKEQQGEDNLKTIAKMWKEKYDGAENAGATAFLDNGAEYTQLALSPKDLDWLEGQRLAREEICAAFGVPPNIAGILDRATYENITQASKLLWNECLIPLGNKIASTINRTLVQPNQRGVKARFDFENHVMALQEDQSTKIDRYVKLVNEGFVTPRVAAEQVGVKLGVNDPAHDVIWISYAKLTTEQVLSGDSVLTDTNPTDPAQQSLRITTTPEHKALSNELKQARGRVLIKETMLHERRMRGVLKTFFYDQRVSVLKKADALAAEMKMMKKAGTLNSKTAKEIADFLMGEKNWTREMIKRVMPVLKGAGQSSAMQVLSELKRPTSDYSAKLVDNYLEGTEALWGKITEYTRSALIKAAEPVVSALTEGKPIDELMTDFETSLKGVFNNEPRRFTIARTETGRVYNGVRMDQMTEAGVGKKQWLTIMDGDERDSHAAVDNEVVKVDANFSNGLAYPLDAAGPPGETINCRCQVLPYFDD